MRLRLSAGLVSLLLPAAAAAAAAPPLLIARTAHFAIVAAESTVELRSFAESLERYDAVLRNLTGTKSDAGTLIPLTIYVVADEWEIGQGSSVVGYYDASAAGPYAVVPRKLIDFPLQSLPRIILFHEYAHHFMLQNYPVLYSPWVVEGLAEFYSTTEVSGASASIGNLEPMRLSGLMTGWNSPLARLIAPGDRALNESQTVELYERSWLLVHYLTLSKQRGGQLNRYLTVRSQGATEEESFKAAFGISIAAMDKELLHYFTPHELPFLTVDLPAPGAISIRTATPGEAAIARLTPRLRRLEAMRRELSPAKRASTDATPTGKDAAAELTRFRRLAGSVASDASEAGKTLPDDPAVQTLVAESDLAIGDLDAARSVAARAVLIGPRSARAHLIVGEVALATAAAGDLAAMSAARREIIIANRTAPDDPLPLIAYFRSFAEHGAAPPAIAVAGLVRAQQLAPQDGDVRVMLAGEEIKLKHDDVAAALLRPVAFAPHPGPRRDAALKLLKGLSLVDRQDPDRTVPAAGGAPTASPGAGAAPAKH